MEDLLARMLSPLVARQVPVRSVSPGPLEGVARVRWADGTVLLVRSSTPGALTRVSVALAAGAHVVASEVQHAEADPSRPPTELALILSLERRGRRAPPLELMVLGLDQPD
jgi:hypothetical protein